MALSDLINWHTIQTFDSSLRNRSDDVGARPKHSPEDRHRLIRVGGWHRHRPWYVCCVFGNRNCDFGDCSINWMDSPRRISTVAANHRVGVWIFSRAHYRRVLLLEDFARPPRWAGIAAGRLPCNTSLLR